MSNGVSLDSADLRILAALQSDARLTNQDLADRVNLSASQCSRRRVRLEEAGVIRGYRAELALDSLGLEITVFTKVSLVAHSGDNARRFAKFVRGLDCVLEAHSLTGDSDYLLKLVVPDLKSLSNVVNNELLAHSSVAQVHSSVVLETLKAPGPVPLESKHRQ